MNSFLAKLAKKLKTSEEPQYEGLCHLAIARCEQSIGNTVGEAEALISASRSFLQAEENVREIGSPSLEENLSSAIHSYNHAIRLLTENGDTLRASELCLELADFLVILTEEINSLRGVQLHVSCCRRLSMKNPEKQ